ncbi:Acyl-CoA N-acyltransferase [Akanthomyces lecanii RCEF 1005]|uniref:Acyl-CoA N-acyltransferase n=2 Tax=Akanthomyces TaxID=150366 RepID=A0A168IHH6_CORDF|nr:Acyl-CoA N-acyltransferase [Akanthomyces lecanii RCEF 1005]
MSHICRATLPPSLSASEPAQRLAPYIWTHQYTLLSPSTCFVVDDGAGRAVGYCIGCPDVAAFCAAYPRYVRDVLEGRGRTNGDVRLRAEDAGDEGGERAPWIDRDTGRVSELALSQLAFSARRLLLDGHEDLLREGYRATLHIDLLEAHQGRGWGRRLLEALMESMSKAQAQQGDGEEKSRGIWLGVGGENSKVVPFYEKLGFRVKEREVKTSTIIMVRDY